MKKNLILIILAVVLIPSLACGRTASQDLNNAMGQAYKAVTEKKLDKAKKWFRKAGDYAKEAKNWQGLMDAGYGLSTLGLPDEAVGYFNSAGETITQSKDWHGGVALGYAYASLPDKLKVLDKATKIWTESETWAKNQNDLFGLIEVGRGFMSIGKNTQAENCFDLAREILKRTPTEEGIKALVQAYRKLGKENKALECTGFTTAGREGQPPPGWRPTAGESVRSPKTVPIAAQEAQRASADKEIQAREEWEKQQAQLKHEEKLQRQRLAYAAYRDSLRYYSYPYYGIYSGVITNYTDYYNYGWCYRPAWCVRTYPEIYNWALWNLGRYSYCGGFYIGIDID